MSSHPPAKETRTSTAGRFGKASLPLHLAYSIPDHPWIDSADGAAVRIAMTRDVTLPSMTGGTWHLLIVADANGNQVWEDSEANNTRSLEFTLTDTLESWASVHNLSGSGAPARFGRVMLTFE